MGSSKFGAIRLLKRKQNSQFRQLEKPSSEEANHLLTQFRLTEFILQSIQKMVTGTDAEF